MRFVFFWGLTPVLRSMLKRCSALVTVASIANTAFLPLASAQTVTIQQVYDTVTLPLVTAQPSTTDQLVSQYNLDPTAAPPLSFAQMAQLVRGKIKYVFVIFNENNSFDHEYGSFPGANNIYSNSQSPRPAIDTPGYFQQYSDSAGTVHSLVPFLLGPAQNGNVSDSVDHGHTGLAFKLNVYQGTPRMNGFSQDEYNGKAGSSVTAASDALGKQYANLVMSHVDCRTIPFFWQYANRFTLFDNIFATEDTPSSPNAVAMIAGQSGETQWVKHGSAGFTGPTTGTINGTNFNGKTGTTQGPPIVNDPQPFYGSEFDTTTPAQYKQPTSPSESFAITNIASNLTFATVLLSLGGTGIKDLMSGDLNKSVNQADIQNDIPMIYSVGNNAVTWRWYQDGYDLEPTDTNGVASHANWVSHHEGPSYFGYLANNVNEQPNFKGEGDFFTDIANGNVPSSGGVFYIRGGYQNLQGLRSPIQNGAFPANANATGGLTAADVTTIQTAKAGDDDHPSYSDRMISEAMNARVINAIAGNPTLWAQSAIIITYDESDGFYDHVPPRILSYGPDGLPLSRGIRVPLLVISPYARTHVVSHAEGDHNAVIETINAIFNLPALSSLPDEAGALVTGNSANFNQFAGVNAPAGFTQKYLGPRDTNSPTTDSLLSAFDPRRLQGTAPLLPASYAMIPAATVTTLPHYGTEGCAAIGVIPDDQRQGISAPPPANFNSLPSTLSKYNLPTPN